MTHDALATALREMQREVAQTRNWREARRTGMVTTAGDSSSFSQVPPSGLRHIDQICKFALNAYDAPAAVEERRLSWKVVSTTLAYHELPVDRTAKDMYAACAALEAHINKEATDD